MSDDDIVNSTDVLIDILIELRKLNQRIERAESAIASVRLNNSHPLVKLLFR